MDKAILLNRDVHSIIRAAIQKPEITYTSHQRTHPNGLREVMLIITIKIGPVTLCELTDSMASDDRSDSGISYVDLEEPRTFIESLPTCECLEGFDGPSELRDSIDLYLHTGRHHPVLVNPNPTSL